MSPIAEVVTMPAREMAEVPRPRTALESEQPEFDGMPVREERFALKSVSALYTDKRPKMGSHVDGTYSGRVKGYYYVEGVLTTLIEVLDAELGA